MKTTIEIAGPLLREARTLATQEGVTLSALVERGLRRVLAEREHNPPFRLRRVSFGGKGLQADSRNASWETLRDATYQGRGGDSR